VAYVVLMAHQRSGSHLLGSWLQSHPAIKYTGEIFCRREPNTADKMHARLSRVSGGGFPWICVDIKYNQITAPIAEWMAEPQVKVIQLIRRNMLAIYFSGQLHTWRGEHPKCAAKGEIPTFQFEPRVYAEQRREIAEHMRRCGRLADLTLSYEDLTGGNNVKRMPDQYSRVICDLLCIEYAPMITDFDKEGPSSFLDHLNGVPRDLIEKSVSFMHVGG